MFHSLVVFVTVKEIGKNNFVRLCSTLCAVRVPWSRSAANYELGTGSGWVSLEKSQNICGSEANAAGKIAPKRGASELGDVYELSGAKGRKVVMCPLLLKCLEMVIRAF